MKVSKDFQVQPTTMTNRQVFQIDPYIKLSTEYFERKDSTPFILL